MTLDSSDTKNVLFSRICTVLTSFLLSSASSQVIYPCSNWPQIQNWWILTRTPLTSKILLLHFSRGRGVCRSNVSIIFATEKLWLRCSPGFTSIHFLEWIGIPVGGIDEERGAVCFGLAFAADLSALIREFATIFRSGVTGLTVLAKVSSLSSWMRIFSVRSPTNLLSPLKILIHEWYPSLDKRFNPRSQLQAFPHGYWSPLPILDQSLYLQESILLGVDDSSSRGEVYSRHATWPSNFENSSASFVLKHCPGATVFKNLGICA